MSTARAEKGHPKGLYSLFFTEMWERLGFYLMLGILFLYITDTERGGLGFSLKTAGEIYGTYMAFVYFTPFVGGMIADRLLGYRRSVFIGGLLMAAGYFALGVRTMPTFFAGLALICFGNGFFKPNISAMVGNLYAPNDSRRDAGFNIFYMGINIGATLSALLAAPLRNLWSFNMAFTAAGVGMLIGVTVLLISWKGLGAADRQPENAEGDFGLKQLFLTILLPAGVFGVAGYYLGNVIPLVQDTIGSITFGFLIGMLPVGVYFFLLVKRASPEEKPGLGALIPVYVAGGAFFMVLHLSGGLITVFAEHDTDRQAEWIPSATEFYAQKAMPSYFDNAGPDLARPDERTLLVVPDETEAMFGARILNESAVNSFRTNMAYAVTVNDYTGQDGLESGLVSKVYPDDNVVVSREKDSHGVETTSVKVVPETTEKLGEVAMTRNIEGQEVPVVLVSRGTFDEVYEGVPEDAPRLAPGKYVRLLNAEMITGFFNPFFVVICTPLVVWFFAFMSKRGNPVTTARKIFLGMVITAASLLIVALGSYLGGSGSSKISMLWLIGYYLVITLGELCLSPMGLSLVTKLSPKRLVGLMMGGWFLATAIGNKMSGFISGLEPGTQVFVILAIAMLGVAAFIYAMLPRLNAAIRKYGA
jgi:POT family proton-dependent oligopeptide transporter|nr:peptide MFS transporter [Candidatus Krumholzibacteria bacterium]